MGKCNHEKFECFCAVGRLTDGDGGKVTSYCLDVKVQCCDCKEFFEFIGVPAGHSPSEPMTSIDFTELRIPIRPNTGAVADSARYIIEQKKSTDPIN
jgi:hypothetical protein